MGWLLKRLLIIVSLLLPVAACAGDGELAGLLPSAKQPSAAPSEPEPATPTPAPSEPGGPRQLEGLSVSPGLLTLSSDPEAPPGSRMASLTAYALIEGVMVPTTARWTANPSGLLAVSQLGAVSVLPGSAPGVVEVRASSDSFQATARVTIVASLPTILGLQLSASELDLYAPAPDRLDTAGFPTTAQLSATVLLSDNTTEEAVSWSAQPSDVATVDGTGRVMALKAGTALITARSAKDPNASAQCALTVRAKSLVEVSIQ